VAIELAADAVEAIVTEGRNGHEPVNATGGGSAAPGPRDERSFDSPARPFRPVVGDHRVDIAGTPTAATMPDGPGARPDRTACGASSPPTS